MWWRNTALVAVAGVALAVWLWDGVPEQASVPVAIEDLERTARVIGNWIEAGCIRPDGTPISRAEGAPENCPAGDPAPVLLRDLPPNQRPFP